MSEAPKEEKFGVTYGCVYDLGINFVGDLGGTALVLSFKNKNSFDYMFTWKIRFHKQLVSLLALRSMYRPFRTEAFRLISP